MRDNPGVHPGLAAGRDAVGDARGAERRVRDLDAAAQRITGRRRVQRRELTQVAVEDRRGEGQQLGAREPERAAPGEIGLGNGTGRLQAQIRRQHLGCLGTHALGNPVGEKAHGSQGQHGHAQRQQQHRQLAGFQVAPQIAQSEAQDLHGSIHRLVGERPAGIELERAVAALRQRPIVRHQHER